MTRPRVLLMLALFILATLYAAWFGIRSQWVTLGIFAIPPLWLATALHYSWNLVMVFVFGLPVSGFTTFNHLAWLNGQAGSPAWVSGGDYGPEGGAAVTVALLISTIAIWKSGLFAPAEEMLAAIKHGKREPRFVSITTSSDSEVREPESKG